MSTGAKSSPLRFTLETPLAEFFRATGASSRLSQIHEGNPLSRYIAPNAGQARPQTIGELCRCRVRDLKQYNLGKKSFRELRDLLIAHGFDPLLDDDVRQERPVGLTTKLKGTGLSTRAVLAAQRHLRVRTMGELANVIRAGRPAEFMDDGIWEEIVTKLRSYHLVDGDVPGLGGDAPMVALTRSLLKRWDVAEGIVLADWCEEHGLVGAAYHLRHEPSAATRAIIEALACCFGLQMIHVRSGWTAWAAGGAS